MLELSSSDFSETVRTRDSIFKFWSFHVSITQRLEISWHQTMLPRDSSVENKALSFLEALCLLSLESQDILEFHLPGDKPMKILKIEM